MANGADEHAERLASFAAALPATDGEIAFVWQYEFAVETYPNPILIRVKDGPIVWRDATYGYEGRSLFPQLEKILKERYGARLSSFTVDVPGWAYINFNSH